MDERTFETGHGTITASIEYGSPKGGKDSDNPTMVSIRSADEIGRMLGIPRERIACVDVETTGLRLSTDEILQVAICDGNGNALLNSYVRPERRKSWPDAEKVNGITWEMVEDAPSIVDLSTSVERVLGGAALVIGYNVKRFDFEFLRRGRVNLPSDVPTYDLIYDCSATYGKWSDYHGNYSFVSLESMADRYGIEYDAHDALSDAKATVEVFYRLLADETFADKVSRLERYDNSVRATKEKTAEALERERLEAERRDAERAALEREREKRGKRIYVTCLVVAIAVVSLILGSCMYMCSGTSSSSRRRTRSEIPAYGMFANADVPGQ